MESGCARKYTHFRWKSSFPSAGGTGVSTRTLGEPETGRLAPPPWDVSPAGQRGRSYISNLILRWLGAYLQSAG